MREVGNGNERIAEISGKHRYFLVRPRQKVFEDAQLLHHLERRRVNRVAAKVAQKIGVLFEQHRVDAGARKEQRRHHSRRTAADDAAAGTYFRHRGVRA
jgi:hypothetical protein